MNGLIYIVGSGRSGSTVVERVLNSAPNVVAVGEIHALWRLPIEKLLCSCGTPILECAFWQTTLGESQIGPAEIMRLTELEREVVRHKYLVRLGYDPLRIRWDPRLAEFAALQTRLMDGVRVAGQGAIVLDSSKAGPRAWVLAAAMAPTILHLYRGAQDVIGSWRRPKFEPSTNAPMKKPSLAAAALDWVKAEQAARRLAGWGNVARMDYRAFATNPKQALEMSLPALAGRVDWVEDNVVRPAGSYHSVLGNPDRFVGGDIKIAPQHATERGRFGLVERGMIGVVGKALERAYP